MTPEAHNQSLRGFPRRIEISDPEGTYCCHPSPKELREWTIEYRRREEGAVFTLGTADDRTEQFTHYRTVYTDAGERVELTLQTPRIASPCIDPLERDDDTLDTHVDTGDPLAAEAHRRYTRIIARAEKVESWAEAKITHYVYMNQRLAEAGIDLTLTDAQIDRYEKRAATVRQNRDREIDRLTKQFHRVRAQTGYTWSEVEQLGVVEGRDGELALNRDAYEVRYCHRDPSDYTILAAYVPDEDRELLAEAESVEERDDLDYHLAATRRRRQVAEAWTKYWKVMGRSEDVEWQRIVKRWRRTSTGRFAPRSTQSLDQFIEERIYRRGDELAGLNSALASLRYRIVKQVAKTGTLPMPPNARYLSQLDHHLRGFRAA